MSLLRSVESCVEVLFVVRPVTLLGILLKFEYLENLFKKGCTPFPSGLLKLLPKISLFCFCPLLDKHVEARTNAVEGYVALHEILLLKAAAFRDRILIVFQVELLIVNSNREIERGQLIVAVSN